MGDIRGEAELRDILRLEKQKRASMPLSPVLICWGHKPTTIKLRLPSSDTARALGLSLTLEDGRRLDLGRAVGKARQTNATVEGQRMVEWHVPLPRLPNGYHSLQFEWGSRRRTAMVIAAPIATYAEARFSPTWGFFVPMYSLRSQRDWGAGNLTSWSQLSDWADSVGAKVTASLPLLAAFLGRPVCEPSPYSPASRLFWNEFFIDIERAPEFNACKAAQRLAKSSAFLKAITAFRADPYVNYREQYAWRRRFLQLLSAHFFANVSSRHKQFQVFLQHNPRVTDYAQFRAVGDESGVSWHNWESRLRHGKIQPGDFSREDFRYHAYSQWLAEEQFSSVLRRAKERRNYFYLDLPLGVNPDGYDVWREGPSFAQCASVGAPPDVFFTKGQNWGFAPLHPDAVRNRRYDYVIEYLRFQMRNASLLRIDHVMGLHRLWWIPQGMASAVDGAYVSYPAEEFYAILSLESHRNKTMLVGENLGTVPPEVNAAMEHHGVRKMFVLQYEQSDDPKRPVKTPSRASVASLNTHDMPTFAAHWEGRDLSLRQELGLLRGKGVRDEQRRREQLVTALTTFLVKGKLMRSGTADSVSAAKASLRWLARSPADFLLVSLEDLWAETEPQNVPGTSTERPNWARKIRLTLEEIFSDAELKDFCNELTKLRKAPR